jgi:hypothetical protein
VRAQNRPLPLTVAFIVLFAFGQMVAFAAISYVAWAQNAPGDMPPEFSSEVPLDETGHP